MGLIRNNLAFIRGNVKLLFLKIFYPKRIKYNPYLRFGKGVEVRVDSKSSMLLGKGILVNKGTVLSSTDGGELFIGDMVGLNNNTMIFCHNKIEIGDNTTMGPGVCIYDHDHSFSSTTGVKRNDFKTTPVKIGKKCWIGAGAIILRGSVIGDNCLIGAGAVIKGTYASGSIIIQKRQEVIKESGVTNSSNYGF